MMSLHFAYEFVKRRQYEDQARARLEAQVAAAFEHERRRHRAARWLHAVASRLEDHAPTSAPPICTAAARANGRPA